MKNMKQSRMTMTNLEVNHVSMEVFQPLQLQVTHAEDEVEVIEVEDDVIEDDVIEVDVIEVAEDAVPEGEVESGEGVARMKKKTRIKMTRSMEKPTIYIMARRKKKEK